MKKRAPDTRCADPSCLTIDCADPLHAGTVNARKAAGKKPPKDAAEIVALLAAIGTKTNIRNGLAFVLLGSLAGSRSLRADEREKERVVDEAFALADAFIARAERSS